MGRAPCCEKIGLKKGRWAAEEDEKLTKYIQQHGEGCWRSLPRNAGLLRCGKSCRLRWINYLRADLKRGNITPAEEETIVKLQRSLGNRWSVIATHLPGRTDNEIKNYWNSHLSRRIYRFRKSMNSCTPTDIDLINVAEVRRPKGRRLRSTSITKKDNSKPMTFMSTDRMPEKNGANETDDRSKEKEKEDLGINNNFGHEENRELMLLENWDLLKCNNGVNSEECSCCSSDINVGGEVLGPYEWLDSEIERLNGILQKESCGDDNEVEEGKTSGVMGISEERGEKEGFVQLLARDFGSDEKNKITSSRVVENDYDLVRGLLEVEGTLTRSSRTGKDYSRFENGEETLCSVSSTTCDSSSMNSHGFDFDEEWIEWDLGGVGGSSICDGSGFGFYCNDNEELGF